MEDGFKVEMELEQRMCSSCKKSSTDYFELKLHLRLKYYNKEEVDIVKKEVLAKIEKKFNSINKIDEVDNGYDIYFRNYSEMGKITRTFSRFYLCDEKRSKKLIGRDQLVSKDKYRYFQSLILVNLKKGDKVKIRGNEFTIKARNTNNLVLINEDDGSKCVETYSIIKDYLSVDKEL